MSDENVRDMTFDYVIVDEAAKATTPELLVSILKAEKIVLVGDQNQLAPFTDASLSPLSAKLVKDPKFRIFDILYDSLPISHKQFLSTQYRMCSTIGNLISTVFYDGKIITGVADKDRQHTIKNFVGKSIVWISTELLPNHDSRRVPKGSSYNQSEINIIRTLLGAMNIQEDAGTLDVGVNVAFSRAKKLLIICGDMNFFATWAGSSNTFSEIVQYIQNNPDT